MLLEEISAGIKNVHPIVFLPVLVVLIIVISNCAAAKGSIKISKNPSGTGFTANLQEWGAQEKCELILEKGDVLEIEVVHEAGDIAFSVTGKMGSEPYTGNDLKSVKFTVTVSESDDYVFKITGKKATGKIIVQKVA